MEYYYTGTYLGWIPMSDEAITLDAADDATTEVVNPAGFAFGSELRHNIYVRKKCDS